MARSAKPESGNAGIGNGGSEGANIEPSATPSLAPIGDLIIDPAAISAGESAGSGGDSSGSSTGEPIRKRRGRKPGSTNKNKNAPLDINGLEAILLSSHALLAGIVAPQLKIDSDEAHQLATGISNVARHYDIGATEKTLDWCNLFMALGVVYGQRIMAIGMERRSKPKKAPVQPNDPNQATSPNGSNIQYPFPPVGAMQQ